MVAKFKMTVSLGPKDVIRVLHVGKYFAPHTGGMETYLKDLIFAAQTRGVESAAIVHSSNGQFKSVEEVHCDCGDRVSIFRSATWFCVMFTPVSPLFGWHLRRLIIEHKPHIIHLHMPNPSAFWTLILPSAWQLLWVVHWQSDVVTERSGMMLKLFSYLYRPLEAFLLKKADHVIVTSPPYLQHSGQLKSVRKKCSVIPLGITDRFGKKHNTSPSCSEKLCILAIGRFARYKGFDVLLRAVGENPYVELTLIGDGDRSIYLRNLAAKLNILDRVNFLGAVSDSKRDDALLQCDCLCLPSTDRRESFGIVLIEAMSAGKACIVSDVIGSGMSWVVEHEKTGLVFSNQSHTDLASSIQRLHTDRDLLRKMGERARAEFESRFTIEQCATQVESLYRAL